MNKFVIAVFNSKGNLSFVNRYYGGTAKTSENIEDAKIYYSPYDAHQEWRDRMKKSTECGKSTKRIWTKNLSEP